MTSQRASEPTAERTPERVSLIVTVLNEADTIDPLLESVAGQTRAPDEVVVVDAGSTDGTWEKLRRWAPRLPLRAICEPGANISRGRNRAIAATTGELVAATDAGVRLDPSWLERLTQRARAGVDVVSGFFVPDTRTVFERAMAATVLPDHSDVRQASFLPSSRSILFRRQAWDAVGGYPEWLDYCEDVVFDLALKRGGHAFRFAPEAIVWFRPRSSLSAFFRQYYQYARGDGKADLWRRRHAIRYASYVGALLVLASGPRRPRTWLLLILGGAAYTRRPLARLAPRLAGVPPGAALYAVALVPVIRVVGDVAKMLGYPVGVVWRVRHGRPR